MQPQLKVQQANGVDLAYFEWGTPSESKPTLFMVHATGFHGRLWDYQAEALAGCHIIALEQRGHGRSEKVGADHWQVYGDDQAAFVSALGLRNAIGIGHSMGAHGLIQCAASTQAFTSLLLLDPTVSAPEHYGDHVLEAYGDELHPASKRRAEFASAEAMMESLAPKSSFPAFHPRIFRDYCHFGVEPKGEGVRLCCEPEIEARVYMSSRSNTAIFDRVTEVNVPVTIVRAKEPGENATMDFSSSPTWPGLVSLFPQARELHWPDCTHFIPMERPDEVVALIQDEIELWAERTST